MSRRTQELLIRLGESLGKNIGDTRRQKTMQDAFQTFSKDLSKENIEQFMARNPDMSPADIYPLASYINTQAGGVRLNDAGATAVGRIAQMKQAGESIDATSMKKIIEESGANLPFNEQMKHRQNIFNFIKEEGPKISWHKEDEVPIETDPFTGGVKRAGGPGMEGFGPKVEMSKVKEDGTISTVKVRPSEVAEYKNKGYLEENLKMGPGEAKLDNYTESALARLFPNFLSDPSVRKNAYTWYAGKDKNGKPNADIVDAIANQNARSRTPSQWMPLPTSDGYSTFQTRGEGAGRFVPPSGNIPSKPLPESATKEFGALSQLQGSIGKIKELYKPDYVGPIMGRYYNTAEKAVNLPKNQVKFYSYVNDAKDALLRARSGAQINEQEYKRLVQFLPTSELPESNFEARLQRFEEQVRILQMEKAKTYSGQGYKIDIDTGIREDKNSASKAMDGFDIEAINAELKRRGK